MASLIDEPDLLQEFIIEAKEHLSDIENQLLAIEAGGADIDIDLVNTVFRAVHSIKGAAGFFGLSTITDLSHSFENLLKLLRERKLVPTGENTDTMLRAADSLRNLILDVDQSNEVDVTELVSELEAIAESQQSHEPGPAETESAPPVAGNGSIATAGQAEGSASGFTSSKSNRDVSPKNSSDSNIRVSVETLDQLMNFAGELVLGRNQLVQTVVNKETANLEGVAARINQVTRELQDAIMQTRMQPIGNVFSRFSRVVRDLSKQLGKQCELVIEGREVEVDKTISEAIADPLTHLVRNAVDHGMETPETRRSAGKPAGGTIWLRASHLSGKIAIEVKDDGGGFDSRKLRKKAAECGLITAEQAAELSERDALRLIFHPGFSTAEKVSDVSGRGVGMDVVRTNIEKLGGSIEVESTLGSGTSVQIMLPLTLAIIPSLIVQTGEHRFAIPQVNIAELVRVRAEEVESQVGVVKGKEVLRLRGKLLPLVRLSQTLNLAELSEPEPTAHKGGGRSRVRRKAGLNIIVVETGQHRYGLIVDHLHDSEEIVVKPLGGQLKNCRCLSGATILGDGRIALILDVPGIAAYGDLRMVQDEKETCDDTELELHSDTQALLLFSNGDAERFAVPMPCVARIERVRCEQISEVGGRRLLQYSDSTLPLLSLADHINAAPCVEAKRLFVIVFAFGDREIGLIAPQLEDIYNVSVEVDDAALREPGVSGSLVINGATVRLLDIREITRNAYPDWFHRGGMDDPVAASADQAGPRVLLAEDSDFFRKQVSRFLSGAGCQVIDCEDGLVAWETLRALEETVNLVVTDIEMPNMNGLELCRRIKGDPDFSQLPVIALTSLAGDADVQAGHESGVDEYQVKMDEERLIAAVHRFVGEQLEGVRQREQQPELVGAI